MKSFIRIVSVLIAACAAINTYAQGSERIVKKDNTEYKGHVIGQVPGRTITFAYEKDSKEEYVCLKVNDIDKIQYLEINKPEGVGIVDIITTKKDEKFKGQIIEKDFGRQIIILTKDGFKERVDYSEIKTHERICLDDNRQIFEQARYRDVIICKDGMEIVGFMTKQYYGTNNSDNYLEITTKKGVVKVFNSDIIAIRNPLNPEYDGDTGSNTIYSNASQKSVAIKNIEDNYIMCDDQKVALKRSKEGIERNDTYVFTTLNNQTELSAKSVNGKLIVYCSNIDSRKNMILLPCSKEEIDDDDVWAVNKKDLESKKIEPSKESKAISSKLYQNIYEVKNGTYLLYFPTDKLIASIHIVNK